MQDKANEMKYRISQWLDTSDDDAEEYPILYGIQANNGRGWCHSYEDGEPLIFKTAKEAQSKIEALRDVDALTA